MQPLARKLMFAPVTPPLTRMGKESLQQRESDQPETESEGEEAFVEIPLANALEVKYP